MQNAKLLCEERVNNCTGVDYGSGENIVHNLVVKFGSLRNLELRLCYSLGDNLCRVGATTFQSLLQLLHRWRHNKNRASRLAKYLFEVDATHHIDIENDNIAL